jgi:hypothetical protein
MQVDFLLSKDQGLSLMSGAIGIYRAEHSEIFILVYDDSAIPICTIPYFRITSTGHTYVGNIAG